MISKIASRTLGTALLALGITVGAGVTAPVPQAEAASTTVSDAWVGKGASCRANVTIIGVRGSTEPYKKAGNIEGFGDTVTRASNYLTAVLPKGTAVRYKSVNYPAVLNSKFDDYKWSENMGRIMLSGLIQRTANDCAKTKIVLIGYSQGAHVVHHTVANRGQFALNTKQLNQIKSISLFADPIRNQADTTVRQWWGGHLRGSDYSGGVLKNVFGATSMNFPSSLRGRIVSSCIPNDIVCNSAKKAASQSLYNNYKGYLNHGNGYKNDILMYATPMRIAAQNIAK